MPGPERMITMTSYAPHLLTLAAVVLLACVSPGPDFIAVTSNALSGRARGLKVALGVGIACIVWAALAMFGLGLLLTRIAWLYEAIRLAGAGYLLYLGVRMLLAARHRTGAVEVDVARAADSPLRIGLMVGLTNPKSAAFFGSLFISILPAGTPDAVQIAAVAVVGVVALGWFGLLAVMFSAERVRTLYVTLRRPIDAVMGTLLLALGLRLATSR